MTARLACSWNLSAGKDADIAVVLYGSEGSAAVRNVNGSFYDLEAVRLMGTATERLVAPPDDWGGRAINQWARDLARSPAYDPQAAELTVVASIIDSVYDACES